MAIPKMPRIAILGAGWLGESLAQALLVDDYPVVVSTTRIDKAERLTAAGLQVCKLKVDEAVLTLGDSSFFDSDILIVTLPPGGRRDAVEGEKYPAKIARIIEAAQAGTIKQVLFTSSTSVYGDVDGWIEEDNALSPSTVSGRVLVEAEQLLRVAFGKQVTILRLAGLAGPRRFPGRWFAGRTSLQEGSKYVNFVHQHDVVAIIKAIVQRSEWGSTMNVCADEHPVKALFYIAMAEKASLVLPSFLEESGDPYGKRIDNSRSKISLRYSYRYANPLDFPVE